ncbi:WXG100 family type VII secretion target [Mycobacterium sp. AT1]|jgi:WXG100 family type VII secretion target|uniref:WXG100 family type VII secretion target n=1 Tax=Mycobacterium sp. AT1 TaxID=1961706 RepID=UPI0009ADA36A|nr:WXG100 family type VII secretion target [Mycobacterium sp. AT1]OPX07357.1 WXG100 family type VII secretion target [Mycobacterium sp. AT1]
MSFMTDPAAMRDYSGRFSNHATTIHADAQKAYSAAEQINSSWTGDAQTTSLGTMEELHRAFRNIENQMTFVSENLSHSADKYEQQEHANAASLKS